jgi:uncharacterized membrane protein
MPLLVAYVSALVAFLAADMVWLGAMVDRLYRPTIGDMMAANINLPAAALFYVLAPAGLVYLTVLPALKTSSFSHAIVSGAAYGFFTYMTYDLTNQATLKNWSTTLSIVDMFWGAVLSAFAAGIAYLAASRFA